MALSVVREFYYVRELFCHDNLKDSRTGMPNVLNFNAMFANGPAIWGGCVTRRQHRAESWYFSQKIVTVQGGYGTCFCRPGTIFIACWRGRGTNSHGTTFESGYRNVVRRRWRSVAVQTIIGATFESRCRSLLACR